MKQISHSRIRKWSQVEGKKFPSAISLRCPHCSELGIFTTKAHLLDIRRSAMSASASCPACLHHVGIWAINEGGEGSREIFFHPDNHDYHEILNELTKLPDGVIRAYTSTVDAFNAGNYPATAVCCGRTLEGIFKHLLSKDERNVNLAQAIEIVADEVDFAEPIRRLAGVLRKGRNLGAHFDLEKEPDEKLSKAMVELLEYLLSYLFILPEDIATVEKVFEENP